MVEGIIVLLKSLVVDEGPLAGTAVWAMRLTVVLIEVFLGMKRVTAIIALPVSVMVLGIAMLADVEIITKEFFARVALVAHAERYRGRLNGSCRV